MRTSDPGAVEPPSLAREVLESLPRPDAADNEPRIRKLEAALRTDDDVLFEPAERALEQLAGLPATASHVNCWLLIGRWHYLNERVASASRCASTSEKIARTVEDSGLRAKALKLQATCLTATGQDAAAIQLLLEALPDAKSAADEPQVAAILNNLGIVLMDAGHYAGACECFRQSIESLPLPATWANLSQVFLDLGEIASGLHAARHGLALLEDAGSIYDRFTRVHLHVYATQLSIAAGDLDQAEVHASAAEAQAPSAGEGSIRLARLNSLSVEAHNTSKAEQVWQELRHQMQAQPAGVAVDRICRTIAIGAFSAVGHPQEALKLLSDIERKNTLSRSSSKDYLLPDELSAATPSLDEQASAFLKHSQAVALEQSARLSETAQRRIQHLVRLAVRAEMSEEPATGETHIFRVSRLAQLLAREAGAGDEQTDAARLAGLLHDVGKISISDHLLTKSGALTGDEMSRIRGHPQEGRELIATLRDESLGSVAAAVLHSHERWDGAGYPDGLRESAIPLVARIVALADSFDAMTHARSYRPACSFATALAELEQGSGTRYDPELTRCFVSLLRRLMRTTDDLDQLLVQGALLSGSHLPESTDIR